MDNLFWSINYDYALIPIKEELEQFIEVNAPKIVEKVIKPDSKKKRKKQKYNNSTRARSSNGRR